MRKSFLTSLNVILIIFIATSIISCETKERFYRPDLPEKLCTIGIIDLDDTTLRHISFERSFQSEYPEEINDSLRDFSFSISSTDNEILRYKCDSTVKSVNNLRVPDGIVFSPMKKYYLYAKEKDLEEITAEVIAAELPTQPRLISTTVINTRLSEPAGCHEILDVRTLKINFAFEKNEDLYYAILVRASGLSWSSAVLPRQYLVDFTVSSGNTTGFLTVIKGLTTLHWTCDSISPHKKDPTYAYFIAGNKIPAKDCLLTLSVQYWDGHCLLEFINTVSIIVISIPHDLYQFEKSVYTYRKTVDDPFAEPVYINGNIKGGNGIFALCRSKELKITFSPRI